MASASVPAVSDPLEGHLNRQMERSREFFWNRVRWELIRSQLPAGSFDLVDVGAGPGFLGDWLGDNRPDARYNFVEPIEGLERSLIERFGASANKRETDYAGAAVITMMDVLEHIEDDRGFLAELASKMDPGAAVLMTVPAMPSLWSNWDVLLGHHRRYTKASLASAVELSGFEIVERSYLFPELIPLGWWRRLRERRRRRRGRRRRVPRPSRPAERDPLPARERDQGGPRHLARRHLLVRAAAQGR